MYCIMLEYRKDYLFIVWSLALKNNVKGSYLPTPTRMIVVIVGNRKGGRGAGGGGGGGGVRASSACPLLCPPYPHMHAE